MSAPNERSDGFGTGTGPGIKDAMLTFAYVASKPVAVQCLCTESEKENGPGSVEVVFPVWAIAYDEQPRDLETFYERAPNGLRVAGRETTNDVFVHKSTDTHTHKVPVSSFRPAGCLLVLCACGHPSSLCIRCLCAGPCVCMGERYVCGTR